MLVSASRTSREQRRIAPQADEPREERGYCDRHVNASAIANSRNVTLDGNPGSSAPYALSQSLSSVALYW